MTKKHVPVLLEKPVSPTLALALKLSNVMKENPSLPLLLGYTYRWWPPLADLFKQIRENKIGEILYANFVMSANLEDWHLWEPYQDFFMASTELGGGALLDESHFVDIMYWFFGRPKKFFLE